MVEVEGKAAGVLTVWSYPIRMVEGQRHPQQVADGQNLRRRALFLYSFPFPSEKLLGYSETCKTELCRNSKFAETKEILAE